MLVRIKKLSLPGFLCLLLRPSLCSCKLQGIWANICIEYLTLWLHTGQSGGWQNGHLAKTKSMEMFRLGFKKLNWFSRGQSTNTVVTESYFNFRFSPRIFETYPFLNRLTLKVTDVVVVVPCTTLYHLCISLYQMVLRR